MAVLSVMALEGPGDKRIDHQTLVKPTDWMNSLPPHLLNQWGVTLPDQAEGSLSDEDLPIGSDHIYMVMKNYWGHGIPDSEEYVREWTEDTEDVLKFTLMKLEMDLGLPIPLLISRHEKTTPYTEMMGLLQTVCKRLEERVGELEGADDQSPKVKDEVTEKKRLLRLAKEMYQGNDAQVNVRVVTSLALFRSLQASAQASSTASSSPQRAQSPPPPPPADIQFDDLSSSAVIVIVAPEEPVNELRSNPPNQTVSALPQDSPESDTGVVLTPTNSPPLPLVTSSPRNTEQQTASAQQASLPTIPEVGEDMAPVRPIATFPATGSKSKKKKNKGKKSKGKKQSSQELPLPTSTLDAALPETPATMDVATQTAEHEWSAAPPAPQGREPSRAPGRLSHTPCQQCEL
ncbi:hypothetical protein N7493_002009 [Penicillium malachiteum]|uniref:Uncharacterized protein n=1 Tax=Penicillium malachiteum TaxID=1324776 RepID=A0AAD6HV75_9EURO|nr:hypothetical protein N7493_002009 [Penicillium malachiteum]